MNWEKRIKSKLKNRQRVDKTMEQFFEISKSIIEPTFKYIQYLLNDYDLYSKIGIDDTSLALTIGEEKIFKLTFIPKANGEVQVQTVFYKVDFSDNEPFKTTEASVQLTDLTEDKVGSFFADSFEQLPWDEKGQLRPTLF